MARLKRTINHFFFDQPYLVTLRLTHACTRFLSASFYINLPREIVEVRTSKWQRQLYRLILPAVLIWSGLFCIRVGFHVFGIRSNSSYTMTQKLLDTAWLTLLFCNITFKFELYRKEHEIANLFKSSVWLEKTAKARGTHS
jgi:hypothetical protein